MRRLLRITLLMLLCSSTACQLSAQDDDNVGIGFVAGIDKKVVRGLHVRAEAEMRTQDVLSHQERWSIDVSANYRIRPWLRVNAGYNFFDRYKLSRVTERGNTVEDYWSPRHRWYGAVTGQYSVGRWKFGLRERYQYTYSPLQYVPKYRSDGVRLTDEAAEGNHEHLLRSRLSAQYNIRHCALTPGVFVELLSDLSEQFNEDQMRYGVTLDYSIDKHHALALQWRYEDHHSGVNESLFFIGYNFSF